MYEKTPLSRGKSLDPVPFAPGQYIQHEYKELSCRNGMNMFPMLNVRSHCLISVSNVCPIFSLTFFITLLRKISYGQCFLALLYSIMFINILNKLLILCLSVFILIWVILLCAFVISICFICMCVYAVVAKINTSIFSW